MNPTFWLIYPASLSQHPLASRDPVRVELPWVKGKSLHLYFKELRLNGTRQGCTLTRDPRNERLRLAYVPQPDDVIRLTVAGSPLS